MTKSRATERLADCLAHLVVADARAKVDPDWYRYRARYLWEAMYLARDAGFGVGVRLDPKEPDWPVLFIELPTGQVTWHIEAHSWAWDGHDTETKNARVQEFLRFHETRVSPPSPESARDQCE